MPMTQERSGAVAWTGSVFTVRNPATGQPVADVPDMDVEAARRAVELAGDVLRPWSDRSAEERGDILHRAAGLMRERLEDLARTLTLEAGKPLVDSRAEVSTTARYFDWSAEEGRRIYGRSIPASVPNRRYLTLKQPVGVVAAITPWNFPMSLVARKVAPALAAGCTVVLRPASATPLSALGVGIALSDAGLPEGVLSIVTSSQSEAIGELFATHPVIRKLTFTGSTEVGKHLTQLAVATLKRVSMELGGNAPFIVFEDADLEAAADGVMAAKFRNAGQTCTSANRLFAHRSISTKFAELVRRRAASLRLGDGLNESTQVGPLIDESALSKVSSHVKDAIDRGAVLVLGGKRASPDGLPGPFYEPTVLTRVPVDARVVVEETFGPVLPIIEFDSEEEAISRANQTTYGLAAYLWTRDVGRVFHAAERLDYGIVGVNDPSPFAPQLPMGGWKESGLGIENGTEGVESFLETKAVSIGL